MPPHHQIVSIADHADIHSQFLTVNMQNDSAIYYEEQYSEELELSPGGSDLT
jgi:hypothetical protein